MTPSFKRKFDALCRGMRRFEWELLSGRIRTVFPRDCPLTCGTDQSVCFPTGAGLDRGFTMREVMQVVNAADNAPRHSKPIRRALIKAAGLKERKP